MDRKLDIILPLIAAIINLSIGILRKTHFSSILIELIVIIIVFYCIGYILKGINQNIYSESNEKINKPDTKS